MADEERDVARSGGFMDEEAMTLEARECRDYPRDG
jgi:hypothetical protein